MSDETLVRCFHEMDNSVSALRNARAQLEAVRSQIESTKAACASLEEQEAALEKQVVELRRDAMLKHRALGECIGGQDVAELQAIPMSPLKANPEGKRKKAE